MFIRSQDDSEWRDLGRSLAQPPAPSRVRCEITAGCSGLPRVGAWKLPRMVTAKPLWATNLLQSMTVRPVKKFFLIPSLISVYAWFLPTSHHAPLWKAWLKKLLSEAATAVVYACSPTADFGLSCWASCHKLALGVKCVACFHICIKFLFSSPQSNEWNKQFIRLFDDGKSKYHSLCMT